MRTEITGKRIKFYWWFLILGAISMGVIGGIVVRSLIDVNTPGWMVWIVALFCTGCSLAMAIDGLWLLVNSAKTTIKEDKLNNKSI